MYTVQSESPEQKREGAERGRLKMFQNLKNFLALLEGIENHGWIKPQHHYTNSPYWSK